MKNLVITMLMVSTFLLSGQAMARCESSASEAAMNDLSENIGNIKGFESAEVSFEEKNFSKFKNGNVIKSSTNNEMVIESTVAGVITNESSYKTLSIAHICSVKVLTESCYARSITCNTSF